MSALCERAQRLTARLLERTRAAGAVRPDLDVNDLSFVFEQLASVGLGDPDRTRQLRHRYLGLLLDGLHTPHPTRCPAPHPPGRNSAAAGTTQPTADQPQPSGNRADQRP